MRALAFPLGCAIVFVLPVPAWAAGTPSSPRGADELALAGDDECALGVGSAAGAACGLAALQLRASKARGHYVGRTLVADEGAEVAQRAGLDIAGCEAFCDGLATCRSFTFAFSGEDSGKCYAKDRQVMASDPESSIAWNRQHYKTFYKVKEDVMDGDHYAGRSLVANEGGELVQRAGTDVAGCEKFCDSTSGCQSFTFGISGDDVGKCYLKDRQITANDPSSTIDWNQQRYKTYYKVESRKPSPSPPPKPLKASDTFGQFSSCNWAAMIESPTECGDAAAELGHGHMRANLVPPEQGALPAGCFYAKGVDGVKDGLWFNHFGLMQFVKTGAVETVDHQEDGIDLMCRLKLYELLKEGGSCAKGKDIGSQEACATASETLGKGEVQTVPASVMFTTPRGCFYSSGEHQGAWFNGAPISSTAASVSPICNTFFGRLG